MGLEIERKYLVTGDGWKQGTPQRLMQGYLNTEPGRTVRVRIAGDLAFLTIKGKTSGVSRSEFEYTIPIEDAKQLLLLCGDAVIEKCRYSLRIDNLVWEVDEFFGANAGLVVAEVELESESQLIHLPDWVGEEVSGALKYYNSSLVQFPYSKWRRS